MTSGSIIQQVFGNLTRQTTHADHHILQAGAAFNSGHPINRIPVELLVKIFRHVYDRSETSICRVSHFPPSKSEQSSWYPIIAVCRRWHSVALATPMLCSFIPVAEESTPECFELALSRSGDRPIEVTFDGTRAIVASLKVLIKHVSRITSFQIHRVPYGRAQDISRMILMVLPRLHTLDLWFEPAREAEVVMLSFPHDCLPRLRELSLCGAGLQPDPCAQGAAMKLTRLELRDSIDPGCNILEFLHFLQMCRDLEDLTLVRFRPSEDGFDVTVDRRDLETLPVVTFPPRLQRFVLEDLDAYTARLLSALSVPVSTDLVVIKLISPHDPAEIRDVIPLSSDPLSTSLPQDAPGIPSLRAVNGLRLVWRPFASVCLASAARPRPRPSAPAVFGCPMRSCRATARETNGVARETNGVARETNGALCSPGGCIVDRKCSPGWGTQRRQEGTQAAQTRSQEDIFFCAIPSLYVCFPHGLAGRSA
ncbi:hypothetical protein OH76DRAFT_1409034 [Lentinus brumalis]|uniref:Uncharacterized protein n=1 Tax=Lentinus brumalis TaxID=2498619 RepID=A0A371CW10_9APHY|nr:hypothetical protein OH76DRAFT_1409034 [Polyporus brumalis]